MLRWRPCSHFFLCGVVFLPAWASVPVPAPTSAPLPAQSPSSGASPSSSSALSATAVVGATAAPDRGRLAPDTLPSTAALPAALSVAAAAAGVATGRRGGSRSSGGGRGDGGDSDSIPLAWQPHGSDRFSCLAAGRQRGGTTGPCTCKTIYTQAGRERRRRRQRRRWYLQCASTRRVGRPAPHQPRCRCRTRRSARCGTQRPPSCRRTGR